MVLAHTPDQLIAFWTAIGAIATVVAGGIGVVTLIALSRDSRERTRPVMGADLVPLTLVPGTIELVLSNSGLSVAKNVRVTFDPVIPTDSAEMQFGAFVARRYAKPIATFPPAREYRNIYSQSYQGGKLKEPMPQQITVSISYDDSRGKSYTDRYDLDVENVNLQTDAKPSTPGKDAEFRRLVVALEAVARGIGR